MNTEMKENEVIENIEPVDLLEDVDLKNLKVETVPSKVIYPIVFERFKKICFILGGIFLANIFLELIFGGINYTGHITEERDGFFSSIWTVGWEAIFLSLFYLLPLLGIFTCVWKYTLFELAVAKNMKHGEIICEKLQSPFLKGLQILLGIQIIWTALALFFKSETPLMTATALWFIGFIIAAIVCRVVYQMEMERLGLKVFLNSLGDLLGKNVISSF